MSEKHSKMREAYRAKREAGICVQGACDRPAAPGKSRCPACLETLTARTRDAKQYQVALRRMTGRCTSYGCDAPPAEGRGQCQPCLDYLGGLKSNRYHSTTRTCTHCGKPMKRGRRLRVCDSCRRKTYLNNARYKEYRALHAAKRKAQWRERVAAGLCGACGKNPPSPERKHCAACLAYHAARARARREARTTTLCVATSPVQEATPC